MSLDRVGGNGGAARQLRAVLAERRPTRLGFYPPGMRHCLALQRDFDQASTLSGSTKSQVEGLPETLSKGTDPG